ncbi:amidophosphoribosyltransferase [Caldanaerobius fijiensis DSM 17918]|uniref:Amidophosphoribosyltransferase n=1 Tax=Caldanaerobius fijiensis DSM 17918 TaxID=1121256 RepID=A0A1M5A730_9THEO|nr:amidophosphoribosyltransferase [Caldanaerobius fijiensis]SHF25965.1 amidophosphoribosyltransferase [Caldanaerobius fijiensis DSM 17918]
MERENQQYNGLKEACGIFGIYDINGHDTARITYYALHALQHRGQESAGIAVSDGKKINYHKGNGLVTEVFDEKNILHLKGHIAVGHVRYSTTGLNQIYNAQPIVVRYKNGYLALAHNGNLINADELRKELEDSGSIFQTSTDTEVIIHLIVKYIANGMVEAIKMAMKKIKGAYSLIIMTNEAIYAVKDPNGLRPLCLGLMDDSYCFASESCALDIIGAKLVREISPGEIIEISKEGIKTYEYDGSKKEAFCIFEYIYFARPDSVIRDVSVYSVRQEMGRRLALEYPVDADLIVPVPDSGIPAALGYSEVSGIPYGEGLIKNKYVGRTFIQPDQIHREIAVRLKLNVMSEMVKGKKIVLVDDSIVRGTTSKRLVAMLRNAGAKEVHLRISAPPVKFPCYFGIDTPSKKELIGSKASVEDIRKMIGADSLGYLSMEGLLSCFKDKGFCTGCFDGNYPIKVPEEGSKFIFDDFSTI